MRGICLVVAAYATLIGCMPAPDTSHIPIFLPPPYAAWPAAPRGKPIEPGRPVSLNGRQRQAVVVGVAKWMKNPSSVQFSKMEAVQNSHAQIVVCGRVDGRNTAGSFVGPQPFVGVVMGPGEDADFVLVDIGSSDRERAEVTSLCRASGIYGVE